MTHLENIDAIAESGRLLAHRALLTVEAQKFRSLADPNIQARRASTRVPCGRGGVLDDYVPFSFSPRSPMLYRVAKGGRDGVPGHTEGGQDLLTFLVVDVAALDRRRPGDLVITDGHPLKRLTRFEPWSIGTARELLDPEILGAKYWKDTDSDPDRERRRQAELLVYEYVELDDVTKVACRTPATAKAVTRILQTHGRRIPVDVTRHYYYDVPS